MKTLIRVLKVVGGKEYWYRIEGTNSIVIVFRPLENVGTIEFVEGY